MEMVLQPRLEQKLKLAPQIIQSIEILQLPILALQQRITQELENNPVLEMVEEREDEEELQELEREAKRIEEFEKAADLADSWQEYITQTRRRYVPQDDKDEKLEAIQNTPARPITLAEHLHSQLVLLDLQPEVMEIAENIINNLDRNGYLQHPLPDILEAMEKPYTLEQAEEALRVVQSLEPRGVGARDLKECLLLQLDPDDDNFELKKRIIIEHLEDIEKNRLPQIARALGITIEQLKELISEIGTLNPKPGSLYGGDVVPHVVPDVVVVEDNGRYEVIIQDHYMPKLYISPEYRRLLRDKNNSPEAKEWIKRKIESANWLIDSIEQRRKTLYKIASKIVEKQKDFLDHGVSHLKPLKMQEVADEVGVHVSTVSRAIAHKYMQTPRGIFDMKYFFTGGLAKADGEVEATDSVRQKLLDIINNEDKRHPLSDEQIARKLREQGIDIARRTVTKYREAMNIPSSRKRKQY